MVWIEADPVNFGHLAKYVKSFQRAGINQIPVQACLSEFPGREVTLVRYSNERASNSIAPETPLFAQMWPGIRPTGETLHLMTSTLREICTNVRLAEKPGHPRLLVIDVQGHELEVLRGAGVSILSLFDLIQVEVSVIPIYAGANSTQVEEFLKLCDFQRITPPVDDHGDLTFANRRTTANRLASEKT